MVYDHSDCASLFGFCECADCMEKRSHTSREAIEAPLHNTDEWHLWTIRSPYVRPLAEHRREMVEMGFTVGPIQVADGTCGVPRGFYIFSARIPRAALSGLELSALCEWDRVYAQPKG